MKILLIVPPYKNLIDYFVREREEDGQYVPPLGLVDFPSGVLYLATYLKHNSGHQITVIDSETEKLDYPGLRQRLEQLKPELVGISANTFTLIDALKTASMVKNYSEHIPVVLGGPHPTSYPRESLAYKDIDYIVRGEAEISFKEMLDHLGDESRLRAISGIGFKSGGKLILTQEPSYIADLNSLPVPDHTFSPYQKYRSVLSKNHPVAAIITSRGCPYNCIYCDRMGKKFRAVSEEKVLEEVEHCLRLGVKEIIFHDDTFTVDNKRVHNICELINKRGLKFNWTARMRVDTVDYDLLSKMKKAGCYRISFGVETGNPRILKNLKKGITLEQVKDAFKNCRKNKIQTLAYFMIGSPGESRKDIMQTISFAKKLKADYAQFSVTKPYPDAKLYQEALDKGIIKSDVWREFARDPKEGFIPPVWTENFSREEIFKLWDIASKKFYLSPGHIIKKLFKIRSAKELTGRIKKGLALLKR